MAKNIISEASKLFKVFNKEFFENTLEMPQFVIEESRKFAFRYDPTYKGSSGAFLIGGGAADLGVNDFQAAFLHDMVHLSNAQDGISDLTANQYHNKHFLDLALEVGLICIRHKNQGWSITTTMYPRNVVEKSEIKLPEEEAATHRGAVFRQRRPDQVALRQFRSKMRQVRKKTTKTYFLKYVCGCPPPHNSIRSGRRPDGANPLKIRCRDCGKDFACEGA